MTRDDLPRATSIFIDANIFIYHFTGASGECTRFLARCEAGELAGVTSVSVLLEVLDNGAGASGPRTSSRSSGNGPRSCERSPSITRTP